MQNGDTARYPHCFQQHRKLVVESVEGNWLLLTILSGKVIIRSKEIMTHIHQTFRLWWNFGNQSAVCSVPGGQVRPDQWRGD